ncbi:MAG: sigma-70 family RNA polymerase sigma factor [Pseudomonadota bacterium]
MSGDSPGHDDGSLDEAELVRRIAAQDEAAFRSVIETHAPLMHRIAYRMMGDAHEAEDITQEAMLRLWDHAPRLIEKGRAGSLKLIPWLKRVTVNLAIDRLRVSKRVTDEEHAPEQVDADPLADAAIEAHEEGAAARVLIAALPERQRAAIVLTYYEELPNAEAADALDMNIKAFESLLFRARAALRKAFEVAQEQGGAA